MICARWSTARRARHIAASATASRRCRCRHVAVGDQLLVRAGEIVPVDGVVTSAAATIDESALTGEPIPVVKARGAADLQRLAECRRDIRD